jgi:hypothetical protein
VLVAKPATAARTKAVAAVRRATAAPKPVKRAAAARAKATPTPSRRASPGVRRPATRRAAGRTGRA